MRQATTDEMLMMLRDRTDELRTVLHEPDARLSLLSTPIGLEVCILATVTHPPIYNETIMILPIEHETVIVPVQVVNVDEPVQCGPWQDKQRELCELTETIRANDIAMCLAVEIRRRQALEQSVLERDAKLDRMELVIGMLDARLHAMELQFDILQQRLINEETH